MTTQSKLLRIRLGNWFDEGKDLLDKVCCLKANFSLQLMLATFQVMVNQSFARKMALSLTGVEEKSHFNRPDYRVKKKVFAVLHTETNTMVVKLTLLDQSVFCAYDDEIIYPVPGKWGLKGWTQVQLAKIPKAMFIDLLTTAWRTVAGINT